MKGVPYGYDMSARIIELREAGSTVPAICRRLKVGRDYVYATLRRSGVIEPAYKPGRKMSDEQVRELRELREAGWKFDALADRYGISGVMAWKTCNGWREGVQ